MRSLFQILAFQYHKIGNDILYAIFRRSDDGNWQGVAGGGMINEDLEIAARRLLQNPS